MPRARASQGRPAATCGAAGARPARPAPARGPPAVRSGVLQPAVERADALVDHRARYGWTRSYPEHGRVPPLQHLAVAQSTCGPRTARRVEAAHDVHALEGLRTIFLEQRPARNGDLVRSCVRRLSRGRAFHGWPDRGGRWQSCPCGSRGGGRADRTAPRGSHTRWLRPAPRSARRPGCRSGGYARTPYPGNRTPGPRRTQ